MTETHYKNYIKRLAYSINVFWEGNTERSLELILQADSDLDSAVGKHISQRLQLSLETWLKDWREIVLSHSSRPSIKVPNFPQEYVREIFPKDDSPLETSLSCSEIVRESMHEARIPQVNASFEEVEEIICEDIVQDLSPTPEERLQEVFALYKDDRFGEAIRLLGRLRTELSPECFEHPLIKEIESDNKEIQGIFEAINDKLGWIVEDSGKISVKYKNVPGTPTYTLLSEAEIDVPIFNFITLMYEADLYHTWIPFCKKSKTVAKLSRTRKIVWQEFHVPLIATRHACLHGFGANFLTTEGIIVIVSKSCDQEATFNGIKLPENSKSKRAVVNMMGCIVRPLSLNKIHATIITNFDPAIKLVPYKFLNYFSRKLAKGMFKKIMKKAKNFEGSEYQKLMTLPENREFYEFLAKTQEEYLNSLGK